MQHFKKFDADADGQLDVRETQEAIDDLSKTYNKDLGFTDKDEL